MILGMSIYTFVHVLISLAAIASGLIVLYGLLRSDRMDGWTLGFLVLTVATSLTGFGFPYHGVTPAITLGIISMIVLIVAIVARYSFGMAGVWRGTYVSTAVAALYFNVFVLVVQAFQKIPPLHALAPQGNEPPFAIAQAAVLIFFLATGYLSIRRFRPPA